MCLQLSVRKRSFFDGGGASKKRTADIDLKGITMDRYGATAPGAVADGHERARISHDNAVYGVAFSPDGQFLATWSEDNTAWIWNTALDDMLHQLCTDHGRNLSLGEWRRYLGDLPWQPTCENWPTPKD